MGGYLGQPEVVGTSNHTRICQFRGSERERGRSKGSKMGDTLALTELVDIPELALTSGWDLKTYPLISIIPSQSEIFSVIVACSYVLAFQDQTPSQSEIFSVIVACSYVLAFQDQTPSQSEIFSVIVACS